jgi:hypothetical protein
MDFRARINNEEGLSLGNCYNQRREESKFGNEAKASNPALTELNSKFQW